MQALEGEIPRIYEAGHEMFNSRLHARGATTGAIIPSSPPSRERFARLANSSSTANPPAATTKICRRRLHRLRLWARRTGVPREILITHYPHPVRSPPRKATSWDRKRLPNWLESGTERRVGHQSSAERPGCSSNMSFVRNQERD